MNLVGSSELSLAFLIAGSVKATMLFILTWIAARAARRRSAAFRHLVWTVGILGALTLPLVTLLLPAWHSAALGNPAALWGRGHTETSNSSSQILPSMIVNASTNSVLFSKLSSLALLLWVAWRVRRAAEGTTA
jgi:hypothetical protein